MVTLTERKRERERERERETMHGPRERLSSKKTEPEKSAVV
jgi:hypothetical protein